MVSRALNDSGSVEETKKKKILEIAHALGYVPNQAAVTLKKSRSRNIGLCFSTINPSTSPFVLHNVLTGVYSVIGSRYHVIVKAMDIHEPGTLNRSNFDGLLIMSQGDWDGEFMEEAWKKGIPMVAVCRKSSFDIPAVVTDERAGMDKIMDYLLQNGHQKIGVIEGDPGLEVTKLRHEGWKQAVKRRGFEWERIPVEYGNYRYNSGRMAAGRLLDCHKDLTALLCFNDEMAVGAVNAISERGFHVPDDISVTGFDNLDISSYANIRLTTVERSVTKLAVEGTKMLLSYMEEGVRPDDIWLENRLVVRDTVRNQSMIQVL